jgi:hypothetical protein
MCYFVWDHFLFKFMRIVLQQNRVKPDMPVAQTGGSCAFTALIQGDFGVREFAIKITGCQGKIMAGHYLYLNQTGDVGDT